MIKNLVANISDFFKNTFYIYSIYDLISDIILLIIIILLISVIGYGIYLLINSIYIKIRTRKIVRIPVYGKVIDIEYIDSHIGFIYGKSLIPVFYPESYNVYVKYKKMEEVFDDEKLFYRVQKNQAIKLILVKKLDKNNKVLKKYLELPC